MQLSKYLQLAQTQLLYDLQATIAAMARPPIDLQATIAAMARPPIDLQATIAAMARPPIDLQATIAAMVRPSIDLQATIAAMARPAIDLQATIAAMARPAIDLQATIAAMARPAIDLQATIFGMARPAFDLRATIAAMAKPVFDLQATIAAMARSMKPAYDLQALTPSMAEKIKPDEVLADVPQVKAVAEALAQILDAMARSSELAEIDRKVTVACDQLNKLQHPGLRVFLLGAFWTILLSVISSFIFLYLTNVMRLNQTSQMSEKDIVQLARTAVKQSLPEISRTQPYRIVRKQLLVRQLPRARSTVIGKLSIANGVIIIDTWKKWALVEYGKADPTTRAGWVLKKYLARLK